MANGHLKITELVWANTTDLQKSEWRNHPIQAPYWSRKWEWPWVLMNMEAKDGQVFADMGSGNVSPTSVHLGKTYPNSTVYAVDLTPSPFPDTQQIKTLQEDLTKTSIPCDSVDTVICVSVLEHMPPQGWAAGIKEFCRIIKPQGKIIVTLDVESESGCSYHFQKHELEHFIKTIDPTAVIPPRPKDLLTSLTGNLPGENTLRLTVLGFVAKVI